MIKIILSEREFDYELQALAVSFFLGQQVKVEIDGRLGLQSVESFLNDYIAYSADSAMQKETINVIICMDFGEKCISAIVRVYEILETSNKVLSDISDKAFVTGDKNWHKFEGKVFSPYRTYYKNIVKRLMYNMLAKLKKEFDEHEKLNGSRFPDGINMKIPVWGTMTGVRPTKIVMNEIMSGEDESNVKSVLKEVYCCSEDKAELAYNIAKCESELLEKADYNNGYSLYIGIPFCPTTCLYCSFTSYPYDKFGYLADDYIDALIKELKFLSEMSSSSISTTDTLATGLSTNNISTAGISEAGIITNGISSCNVIAGKKLTSVYIGGGTPTALTDKQLYRLLSFISDNFPLDSCHEFTVEAGRPDSITNSKLKILKDFGVKRISVNPQTMKQSTLELIGRKHTVKQTIEVFNMARENGFDNINMDLIIGLPKETPQDFFDTLSQIEGLNPDSFTIHSLVVKRASRLGIEFDDCKKCSTDAEKISGSVCIEKMLDMGQEFAYSHGYKPYYMYRQKNKAGHYGSSGQENIGYAREGKECLYNIIIMEEKQSIVACGAGSISKRVYQDGRIERGENVKDVASFIERIDEMIERKRKLFED